METVLAFFGGLDFYQAIWLLPTLVLAHVAEELPRFAAWAGKTMGIDYTRKKFIVENVAIWVICVVNVALAAFCPPASLVGQVATVFVLGVPFGLLFNTVFHGWSTLKSGVYSPGTVTACLLFPPLAIYILALAASAGLLSVGVLIAAVFLGAGLLPLVVTVVHRAIDRGLRPKALVKAGLLVVAIKAVVLIVLPGLALTGGGQVFDSAIVHKTMVCLGPAALLLLVLKWARNHRKGHEVSK